MTPLGRQMDTTVFMEHRAYSVGLNHDVIEGQTGEPLFVHHLRVSKRRNDPIVCQRDLRDTPTFPPSKRTEIEKCTKQLIYM